MLKILIILLLHITIWCGIYSTPPQLLTFSDNIYDSNIKTVQLFREGWNLSYPVIKLGSNDRLVLHFDFLGKEFETYYYTFIHCSKDWERSDIFSNDYMEGMPENQIEDYKPSFNTTVNYIHYTLAFPNERASFKISGNYILVVYLLNDPENPVITRRFVISENEVNIATDLHRPRMTADNNASQQVDLTIKYTHLNLNDPVRNVYASILQNGIWSKSKNNLKPDLLGNNELKYNTLSDKTIFAGGNEFRYFDIKSIRYKSEFIKEIDFRLSNYHVFLTPSEDRESRPYFYWQDFNGKYYVAIQEGRDPETDADYVYVYFTLPSKEFLSGGKMYVSGAFTDWKLDKDNLMVYNYENSQYECTMLLKQGWYNYEFVYQKDGESTIVPSRFEGNHYQTENDYLILIYYRNPRERYDRVLGTDVSNTLNKLSY